jgi:hypothetical protein
LFFGNRFSPCSLGDLQLAFLLLQPPEIQYYSIYYHALPYGFLCGIISKIASSFKIKRIQVFMYPHFLVYRLQKIISLLKYTRIFQGAFLCGKFHFSKVRKEKRGVISTLKIHVNFFTEGVTNNLA